MKKIATMLLAALLCLSLLGACAESVATTKVVHTLAESASVIDGTELLYMNKDGGALMASLDGTALTEAVYNSDFYQFHGYLTASKPSAEINCSGLLSKEGKEIVPFQYGDVDVRNENWAMGVKLVVTDSEEPDYRNWMGDDVYMIESVDVYRLPAGELKATLTRDQYLRSDAYGEYLNIEDRTGAVTAYDGTFAAVDAQPGYSSDFSYMPEFLQKFYDAETELYGLQKGDGTVVMEPAYEYIYVSDDSAVNGYVEVEQNGLSGLADLSGKLVVPMEYDSVHYTRNHPYTVDEAYQYENGGYFCVEKDDKLGFVDMTGAVTCEVKYSADDAYSYGLTMEIEDENGVVTIVAADGAETVLSDYEYVIVLGYTNGMYYKVRTADYLYGVIDWHGNIVLPVEYDSIQITGDGAHLLTMKDGVYEVHEIVKG